MSSVDADTNNGYFHLKMTRPTVEIPPRKLLFSSVKKLDSPEKEPDYDSDGEDPYGTDSFRMYEFKIRRCTRSRSHDWTDCPFAHPGEKARRRDPRRWPYSGEPCAEFRRGGGCSAGDECGFAHGVFESWLHPSRYRTEACKDGKGCKRKVCFFAHTPRQLRVPPPENVSSGGNGGESSGKNRCCVFCRHSVVAGSPTSTLLGLSHLSRSPSMSPPMSPAAVSRRLMRNYKEEMMTELLGCMETMNIKEPSCGPASPAAASTRIRAARMKNMNSNWLEPGSNLEQDFEQYQQFPFSPSTKTFIDAPNLFGKAEHDDGNGDPDLGWVNDLLT